MRWAGYLCAVVCLSLSASGPEKKPFSETSKDFGIVHPKDRPVHEFVMTNTFGNDIFISGLKTSCGCTTATLRTEDGDLIRRGVSLKPGDRIVVHTQFNSDRFRDFKQATITVQMTRPYYEEFQLVVKGTIVGDLVLEPKEVSFIGVEQGETPEQLVKIRRKNNRHFRIQSLKNGYSDLLETEWDKTYYEGNDIVYQLKVRLKEDAPLGVFNGILYMPTNQHGLTIPLSVTGQVIGTVSASQHVNLTTKVGESESKKILVRAKKPFKLESVTSENNLFEIDVDKDAEKKLHFISVSYTGKEEGTFVEIVEIQTNIQKKPLQVRVLVTVTK